MLLSMLLNGIIFMLENINSVILLVALLGVGSSYAECGHFDEKGKAQDAYHLGTINGSGGNSSDYFKLFACGAKYCSFALYDDYMGIKDGCDTEEELIESAKKIFGRNIGRGIRQRPFIYGNLSKKMKPESFYVGCNFLKIKTVDNIDSVSAFFHPEKDGTCPVYIDVDAYDNKKQPRNEVRSGVYIAQIRRTNGQWNINMKYYRDPARYFQEEDAEFVYTDEPFDLFVEPCKGDRCSFYTIEKMPFPRSRYDIKHKNSVVVRNTGRIKPSCDFIEVEETADKYHSGIFAVSGTGHCRIQIIHRIDGVKNIGVEVRKEGKNYQILLEAN